MGVNCLIFAGTSDLTALTKSAGPYRIATELRNQGYTVQVVDITDELNFGFKHRAVLKKFVDKDTLWVGFSTTFLKTIFDIPFITSNQYHERDQLFQSENLVQFMDYAKKLNSDIKFVVGGARTFDLLKYNFFIFKGFNDESIIDFTNKCASKQEIDRKIIIDKEYNGFNHCNIVYNENDVFNNELFLPIEISRGCIFKCKFCSYSLNGKKKFDYIKDYDVLRNEFLRNYDKFGITNYIFADDTYNDSVIKIKELYDNVYSKLPFKIKFMTYLRLDLMMRFPEMQEILAESGLITAFFGIETLDPDNAKLVGKGINPLEQMDYLHKLQTTHWKNLNIKTTGSFIVGLPHDTREKLNYLREWLVSDNNPLDFWVTSVLGLFDNDKDVNQSEFTKNYQKYGYELQYSDSKGVHWNNENIDMTYDEVVAFQKQLFKDRSESKRTSYAGFDVEQQANIHQDLNLVLNNTIHELNKMNPEKKIEERVKSYFKNLMQLKVP